MGKLVVSKERFVVQEVDLDPEKDGGALVFVGRNEANDVCLPSLRVSKRHASIQARPEGFFLTDLGSTNGTLVNSERVAPYRELELFEGDVLEVAPYLIHCEFPERPRAGSALEADAPSEAATLLRDDSPEDCRGHELRVSRGGRVLQILALESGAITVGGSSRDTLRLAGLGTTGFRLFRTAGHYFVAVVGEEEVVQVGAKVVNRKSGPLELPNGSVLRYHGHEFGLSLGGSSSGAAPTKARPAVAPKAERPQTARAKGHGSRVTQRVKRQPKERSIGNDQTMRVSVEMMRAEMAKRIGPKAARGRTELTPATARSREKEPQPPAPDEDPFADFDASLEEGPTPASEFDAPVSPLMPPPMQPGVASGAVGPYGTPAFG
ncbi:MAG: FHA domain-containing protein, partial [Planctomycetota bacterium]